MEEEIVCIAEVYGVLEGEWCRSLLEANGVPVMLSSEAAGSAFRVAVGVLGRVQVFVPSRLAEQARQILAARDSPADDSPSESNPG